MDRMGDQLLADAAFARNQDLGVGARDQVDFFLKVAHDPAGADQLSLPVSHSHSSASASALALISGVTNARKSGPDTSGARKSPCVQNSQAPWRKPFG